MIFWAWKGRFIIAFQGSPYHGEKHTLRVVKILYPSTSSNSSDINVSPLERNGQSFWISRENCYPLWRLRSVLKENFSL